MRCKFPILHCTNNKDILNNDDWEQGILRKVGKVTYELHDTTLTEKVEPDDIEWDGDEGLMSSCNMYYKYPSNEYMEQIVNVDNLNSSDNNDVVISPRQESLWKTATVGLLWQIRKFVSVLFPHMSELQELRGLRSTDQKWNFLCRIGRRNKTVRVWNKIVWD